MSDLISRSVLIENLNSIEFGIDFSQIPYNMPVEKLIEIVSLNTFGIVMEHINAQPTAYDVEKVVAELENEKERHECDRSYWAEHEWKDRVVYNECDMSDRKADCFCEAINIVKRGGVE